MVPWSLLEETSNHDKKGRSPNLAETVPVSLLSLICKICNVCKRVKSSGIVPVSLLLKRSKKIEASRAVCVIYGMFNDSINGPHESLAYN